MEIVNGTVIGPVTDDTYIGFHDPTTGKQLIANHWYTDESAAIAYVKSNWPSLFACGLEMRVHA